MRGIHAVLVLTMMLSAAAPAWAQSKEARIASRMEGPVHQLRPLKHENGEPFFPIGAYSLPDDISIKEAMDNGWNTIRYHIPLGMVKEQSDGSVRIRTMGRGKPVQTTRDKVDETLNDLYARFLERADRFGLEVIIQAQELVLLKKYEKFTRRLEKCKQYDSFLGFYMVDEPCNHYWSYEGEPKENFNAWVEKNNIESRAGRIDDYIRRQLGWSTPLFHAVDHNPYHYTFYLMGWSDKYYDLGGLADVMMANTYPGVERKDGKIVGGDLARVLWDARNMAGAATAAGRGMGFIYTPLALDQWGDRAPREDVIRYTFFAPVTQGAMGIVSWAGYRNSRDYARRQVFPVTRQLSELSDFFLGDWLDGKLSWSPMDRNHPQLKKYAVPRVSACLRRREDGRLLLLAVNNTAEPTDARFSLDMKGLPDRAREFFRNETVSVSGDGVIEDEIGPYGVKGYMLKKP